MQIRKGEGRLYAAPMSERELKDFFMAARMCYAPKDSRLLVRMGEVLSMEQSLVPDWMFEGKKRTAEPVKFITGRFGQMLWWGQESSPIGLEPTYNTIEECKDGYHPKECKIFGRRISKYMWGKDHERFNKIEWHMYPKRMKCINGEHVNGFIRPSYPNIYFLFRFLLDFGIFWKKAIRLQVKHMHFEEDPSYLESEYRIYKDRMICHDVPQEVYMSNSVMEYWKNYVSNILPVFIRRTPTRRSPILIDFNLKAFNSERVLRLFKIIKDAAKIKPHHSVDSLRLSFAKQALFYTRDIVFTHHQTGVGLTKLKEWMADMPSSGPWAIKNMLIRPNDMEIFNYNG